MIPYAVDLSTVEHLEDYAAELGVSRVELYRMLGVPRDVVGRSLHQAGVALRELVAVRALLDREDGP